MHVTKNILILFSIFASFTTNLYAQPLSIADSALVIWEEAPHNGFPLMVYFEDRYYLTLREGEAHGGQGSVRLIRSTDNHEWESVMLIEDERGWDLREGHLSIMPDGRLHMTYTGFNLDGPPYLLETYAIISENGTEWSEPALIPYDNFWLYDMTWFDGTGYVLADVWGDGPTYVLFSTEDGVEYSVVDSLGPDTLLWGASESDILFDEQGHLWAAIRGGQNDLILADADPPYTDWRIRLGDHEPGRGRPSMIRLPNNQVILGSRYVNNAGLYLLNLDSCTTSIALVLPSGGDSGYPDMVVQDNQIKVVYYSTHEDTVSRIYLANVNYDNQGIDELIDVSALPYTPTINAVWPNPFNSAFTFDFRTKVQKPILISLYDINGRRAAVIADQIFERGIHRLSYNATQLPSGTYFLQIEPEGEMPTAVSIISLK